MTIRYPQPLRKGDVIGITAPSSGIAPELFPRLDLVIGHLRSQGFEVVEGRCLRSGANHVSGPAENRAKELTAFWEDERIAAIMPPWGGETLVEILPLLDFDRLRRSPPTWVSGYSDISTLLFPLTTLTQTATLHGTNLMELAPAQTDPLTIGLMRTLALGPGERWTQRSSTRFQPHLTDLKGQVEASFSLTEPTRWRALQSRFRESARFQGRMIGGCLDTIARLVGTPYGDLPAFREACAADGVIFYFENCELPPFEVTRTLWNLKLAGWFDDLRGVLVGRSSAPEATDAGKFGYVDALESVLGGLTVPVIYDADIGHLAPQLNIVNGSVGDVSFDGAGGSLDQVLR